MKIVVYGNPAPQGSKKFMGIHSGRAVLTESSKKVRPWRQDVKAAAEAVIARLDSEFPWAPLDGPLMLTVAFTMPAPKSLPKRRPSQPAKTPDLSKLIRSTEDALTSAGVWRDDALVVEVRAVKTYPIGTLGARPDALRSPGAVIEVFQYPDGGGSIEI